MNDTSTAAAQPDAAITLAANKIRRPRRMAREDAAAPGSERGEAARGTQATPRATSKIASVITLLGRGEGATLAELIAATGWLPHTTRAALTGLRKKGHAIVKSSREGSTCYRIEGAA